MSNSIFWFFILSNRVQYDYNMTNMSEMKQTAKWQRLSWVSPTQSTTKQGVWRQVTVWSSVSAIKTTQSLGHPNSGLIQHKQFAPDRFWEVAGCFWYLMVNVDRSRPKNWFYECAVKGCWTFGQFSCYTSHVSFSNHCCRWSELLKDQGLSGKGWIDSLQWSLASVEPRNKTLITFHHQNLLFNGDSYHGIFNQPY